MITTSSTIYWWFSHHTCHVGMYRTKEQKVFWEVDSIIVQGMSHNVLSFCVPTWLSCHVVETIYFSHKFFYKYSKLYGLTYKYKFHSFVGTDKQGFGFGGTGKKSFGRQFDTYGEVWRAFLILT